MKHVGFVSLIAVLATLNANADNFVWQFYDDTYYKIIEDLNTTINNAGKLTGISDIYWTYTFDTKSCTIEQTEWLSDGYGGEVHADYDSIFFYNDIYLNNPNLYTEILLYDLMDEFLASYREQALADVNTMIDDIVSQTNATNISEYELNTIAEMAVNDIFSGADITSPDIYKNLQQSITALSKRDDDTLAIATAIGNTTITSAELAVLKLKLDYYLHHNVSEYTRLLNNITPNTATLKTNTTKSVLSAINNQVSSRVNNIHGRAGGDELNSGDIWAQGLTNYSKKTGDSAFDSNTFGITTGIDKRFNNSTIIGFGYTYNNTKANAGDRKTDITGHTFFVYGEYRPFNTWYLSALLSSGMFSYTDDTNVVKSDYQTYNFGANLTTGYDWNNEFGILTGAKYFNINQNKYTDSIGQHIDSENSSVLTIVVGGKYNPEISSAFIPNFHINVTYDILQPDNKTNVDIAGVPYQIKGENIKPFGIETGIALNLYTQNWNFEAGYDLEWHSDFISHTSHIRAKYSF